MHSPITNLIYRVNISPQGNAVLLANGNITYAQIYTLAKKIASKLSEHGVSSKHFVITILPDKQTDWIFTLSLFILGASTCSNHGLEIPEGIEYDWVISIKSPSAIIENKLILINNEWIEEVKLRRDMKDPISYEDGDSICRVVFTSGTTGKRKALALSVNQVQSRAINYGVRTSFGTEINLMMLSTYGGFNIAFSNLIKGRPNFFFKGPGQLLRILEKFNIGLLGGSPIQISKFIEFLKAKDKKLKLNAVRCGGSAISKKLLEDIRVYLSKEVINTYSSTEVGSVCIYPIQEELQFNVAGYVLPDVDIQILGDNKEPLDFNEEGIIRIRTPYMANKYFQSTEFNYLFEDGWFYPGDMGKLDSKGLLTLSGRSDEVINRGGVKIDPSSIDDYLSSQSGVKDVATFKVLTSQGDVKLLSVLVVEDKSTFDIEALKNNFLKTLGNARIPDKFELVDEIPRSSMGKTPRKELSDKYQHLFN